MNYTSLGFAIVPRRFLTVPEMKQQLNQIKEYLVHLEDNQPDVEKLQNFQNSITEITFSINQVDKMNHQSIAEIASLKSQLETEIADRINLQSTVDALNQIVHNQQLVINSLQIEKVQQHSLLIIRQIATSFQHKAAKYCGVGKTGNQSCITYQDLERAANKNPTTLSLFEQIRRLIVSNGFSDEIDFISSITSFKEIGKSSAHPYTSIEGTKPTQSDIIEMINTLCNDGLITETLKSNAVKVLSVIQAICNLLGSDDLLDSKS